MSDFNLPTNPDDVKKIEQAVLEIAAQTQMIKDRQENIKEIKTDMKETYAMPVSMLNKLVKAHLEDKYEEMTADAALFELVYETLFRDAVSDDSDED